MFFVLSSSIAIPSIKFGVVARLEGTSHCFCSGGGGPQK